MSKIDQEFSANLIKKEIECDGADFESAIAVAGFGKFNIFLIFAVIFPAVTSVFEVSTYAFALPIAQCDLQLTPTEKGILNSVIFSGTTISTFFAGSVVDLYGRKRVLITSVALELIFGLTAALATNFYMLTIAKFFGGFFMVGNLSAIGPYLAEFHGKKYREKVTFFSGILYSLGNICLPLIGYVILTRDVNIQIFKKYELHQWNIFLLVCSTPALLSVIIFSFLPESPKYLMSKGNNSAALEVFQIIYKYNKLTNKNNYPIVKLIEENNIKTKQNENIQNIWKQLFKGENLNNFIWICLIQFCVYMSNNTLRQWWPEIYQTMNEFDLNNNISTDFCEMMTTVHMHYKSNETACAINFSKNGPVYINSITGAAFTICASLASLPLITIMGKRRLLNSLGFFASISLAGLYLAKNSTQSIGLIYVYIMSSNICRQTLNSVIIELFPTALRASAISISMVSGRIGSLLGNIIFPPLLLTGCGPPWFTMAAANFGWTMLTLFIPNNDLRSLK